MLRTSRPCAVTTSGASTEAAIRPDGTRKCAQTTSGRGAAATCRRSSRNRRLPARAPVEHGQLDLVARARGARARAGARTRRGRGRPAPDTSARRARIRTGGLDGLGPGRRAHEREARSPRSGAVPKEHLGRRAAAAAIGGARRALRDRGRRREQRARIDDASDDRAPMTRTSSAEPTRAGDSPLAGDRPSPSRADAATHATGARRRRSRPRILRRRRSERTEDHAPASPAVVGRPTPRAAPCRSRPTVQRAARAARSGGSMFAAPARRLAHGGERRAGAPRVALGPDARACARPGAAPTPGSSRWSSIRSLARPRRTR